MRERLDGPGHQVLAEAVARTGADTVFSMLGASNVVWIGHGVRTGAFRLVKTRHETAAVTAAATYGRVTGALGVCSVSHGAGFTNAIHALTACAANHQPVLVLTGMEPASERAGRVDQRAFARAAGVELVEVRAPDLLAATVRRCADRAGRTGVPQVVSIDPALQDQPVPRDDRQDDAPAGSTPDPNQVAVVVDLLERARHPLILAGQGAVLADARAEIEDLSDLVGGAVATTLVARHFFAGGRRDLGLCGGWAAPEARDALADSDLVVGFGASFDPHTFGSHLFGSDTVAVTIDVDPAARAAAPEPAYFVEADAGAAATAIATEWRARGHGRRTPSPRQPPGRSSAVRSAHRSETASQGLDLFDVLRRVDALLPPDRVIVTDSGRHLPAVVALLGAADARHFVISRGHGSVGLGLGAALGAAAGARGRPVVLVCGDGGLMMSSQELDSVRLNGLDLTIIVLNDEQYGAEVAHLTGYGLPPDVARQDLPDIGRLARAFRGTGRVVATMDELASLRVLDKREPTGLTLVDVRIDPRSDGFAPFVGASGRSRVL